MTPKTITVLHPGSMGAAVADHARSRGAEVRWVRAGRSEQTEKRAVDADLTPTEDLSTALEGTDVVLSICPPAAAEAVAKEVAACDYAGVYVEANAISPQGTLRIAKILERTRVVDGSLIGPPPRGDREVRLYLSGPEADTTEVAGLFDGTRVSAVPLGHELGQASALKMAYASFTKASAAMAAVSYALADRHDVGDQLRVEADRISGVTLADPDGLSGVAARAWRWGPEMRQAAEALASVGLPDDYARAAASVMSCWDDDKDDTSLDLDAVLGRLRAPS